ncbi:hypothetical protein BGP_2739 [Beggiatoa sp. PS]|nr:hypothetical protein BGP_2739 [Beggiatoa sp. PS]
MKDDDKKIGRPKGTKNPYYMPSEQVRVPTELVGIVKSLVKTYREQRKVWLETEKTMKNNKNDKL